MHADSVLTSVYLALSFTPMVCELNSFASVHAFCDEAHAVPAAVVGPSYDRGTLPCGIMHAVFHGASHATVLVAKG
jgi:hypothetical protein